jgi:hypothetical protein
VSRKLLVLLIAAGAVIAAGSAAWADGGSVAVQCRQGQGPGCTVAASSQTVFPASSAKVQPVGATDGVCHDSEGKVVPCFIPEFGWLGTAGCYWKVDTGYSPPAWDTADQHQGQQGAWFDFTCLDVRNGTGGGIVWLPTAPGGGLAPPPPVVLARQATNRLVLFPPVIEASPDPGADQLVNLPTWLWVRGSSWGPASATASVPGESVTATATPESVTWSMGDGSKVVCRGPGTPYTKAQNPRAPSPDCGHTYLTSSADQLSGAYPVSATVTWLIRWSGGGQSGAFPALTTTASAQFRVAESQAVNTEPGGG